MLKILTETESVTVSCTVPRTRRQRQRCSSSCFGLGLFFKPGFWAQLTRSVRDEDVKHHEKIVTKANSNSASFQSEYEYDWLYRL